MDIIFGRNPVLEALKNDREIERVYILDSLHGDFEKEVRKLCTEKKIPLNRVPRNRLDLEVKGNHQGIYAVCSLIQYAELEELFPTWENLSRPPLVVLIDGVQDVRNLGAIARTAEIFGVQALVIPARKSAALNEVAIKASAGALTHLPVCRVRSMAQAIELLAAHDFTIAGAESGAREVLEEIPVDGPMALVLGAEGEGIDRHLTIYFDHLFHIPQEGKTSSLNVSVAAGIILYEINKKRKW